MNNEEVGLLYEYFIFFIISDFHNPTHPIFAEDEVLCVLSMNHYIYNFTREGLTKVAFIEFHNLQPQFLFGFLKDGRYLIEGFQVVRGEGEHSWPSVVVLSRDYRLTQAGWVVLADWTSIQEADFWSSIVTFVILKKFLVMITLLLISFLFFLEDFQQPADVSILPQIL
jgi:hypothetical protein